MNAKSIKLSAIIGGSAAVSAAAIGVAILQGPGASSIAGDMETGVTVTETTAPSEAQLPIATPSIKGPAPLPTEEQGLPG